MTLLEQIKKQASALPVEKQSEVLDFIIFLQQRVNAAAPVKQNSLPIHETSLSEPGDVNVREQSVAYVAEATMDESFPNIEVVELAGRKSAVIRSTRIPVHILIEHLKVGETPDVIANKILPQITLAQTYEAIHYYFVHQAEIDKEREENADDKLFAEFAAWEIASDEALENFEKGLKK